MVISTWMSGVPELVQHNVNGILVPERDADALAEALTALSDNINYVREMGVQGREHVQKEFNIEDTGLLIRKLIRHVHEKEI